LIQETIGISSLPENLQEIAKIRIEYEDMTLKELGEMLEPPIGKSGVNHRLRKIEEIATDLKKKSSQ
ncbi:DNA-binding protein WhiA, partial [Clostridioides difficile]